MKAIANTGPVASQWDVGATAATSGVSAAGLWRCLKCQGELEERSAELVACRDCTADFPAVGGIPDLRTRNDGPFNADADLEEARRFYFDFRNAPLEAVMAQLCGRHDDASRALRVRQIMESPRRVRSQLQGWLRPCLQRDGLVLDVGCGSGGLVAELANLGFTGAGIDASMMMLVAAKHMIEAHGGVARLACAYAEALPVASATLGTVLMFDSIEHVGSVAHTLDEARRVITPGGYIALSTPNRFSLSAEPHVFLWGVGWLPRSLQVPYVQWRNGQDYRTTRLLSTWEMARELRRFPDLQFELRIPQVPEEEIEHFSTRRAMLARLYNRIVRWRGARPALLAVGAFYQVIAQRS